MLTNAKYLISGLIISIISSIATFAWNHQTLDEMVEQTNREAIIQCLTEARTETTSQKILQATETCNSNLFTTVSSPLISTGYLSTGTVTSANSEVPLGITPITASPVTSESTKKVQSHTKPVPSVKKIVPVQSSATSSKYWTAYEIAISQIQKWEGLRLKAYWDHAGYSIGYGSRAKSYTETITQAEADRRLAVIAKQLITKVQKDFPTLRPEAQGALVSFAYNCNDGYQSLRKNGLSYHGQWCRTASGKRYDGLVARRAEESKLIFSK